MWLLFIGKSLNHLPFWFVQTDWFIKESSDCFYKWAIESFTQPICSKHCFIHKRIKWPHIAQRRDSCFCCFVLFSTRLCVNLLFIELLFKKRYHTCYRNGGLNNSDYLWLYPSSVDIQYNSLAHVILINHELKHPDEL